MGRVKIKICGITCREDLEVACNIGADAVGFIVDVPSSPRNLTVKKAEELIRHVPIFVKSVLVIAPQDLNDVLKLYGELKPDIIQIHGDLNIQFLKEKLPNTPIIRSIAVKSEKTIKTTLKIAGHFDAVLLDSYSKGRIGGTGVVHDWSISRRIRDAIYPKPLILAGGLNSENVRDAIKAVKPYAVDVSTGVELKPGVKDPEKIEAFIRNAREAIIDD
ncbi:MAG: phosphoribosylanthranilate isomerase [Candidatus Methanomethylicia archaeon]